MKRNLIWGGVPRDRGHNGRRSPGVICMKDWRFLGEIKYSREELFTVEDDWVEPTEGVPTPGKHPCRGAVMITMMMTRTVMMTMYQHPLREGSETPSLDGTLTRVTGLPFNRIQFNEQFLTFIPIGAVDLQDFGRRGA